MTHELLPPTIPARFIDRLWLQNKLIAVAIDYVIVARIFWLRMRQGDNAEPSMEPSPTVTLR
jgi:hypothetical protein